MKKLWLDICAVFFVLLCSTVFMSDIALAEYDGVAYNLEQMKLKFPDGKYWNHQRKADGDDGDSLLHNWNNSYGDSITDTPCATHNGVASIGQYDCNAFDGAVQCYGFANRIFYGVFGQYCSKLSKRTDIANIQPGDHVRFTTWGNTGHSAVVWKRDGDTLTLAEGSYAINCRIKWGRTVSLSNSGIVGYYHATNWDDINKSHVICPHDTFGSTEYSSYHNQGHCTNPKCDAWLPHDNVTCTTGIYKVISGKTAYLRMHPYRVSDETIGELLASPTSGTRVVVTGAVVNGLGNLWYKVLYAGYEGYIVSDSLQLVEEVDYIAPEFKDLPSKESSGQTTWTVAKTITVSGTSISNVSKVGMVLYNTSNTVLKEKEEPPISENGVINAWYEIGSGKEINYSLSPGTTYKYRFFVVLIGETERRYSGYYSFTTSGTASAPNPVPPTVTEVTSIGQSVTVKWSASNNAASYNVYLVQSPWGWEDIKYNTEVSGITTSYTFSNVLYGDYCAFVIARPNENSSQSNWVSVSVTRPTDGPAPTPQYGTLDVNGCLDGDSNAGNVAGYGTFTVFINGVAVRENQNISDYFSTLPAGTKYSIRTIQATSGHVYAGVTNGSLSGTITANTLTDVRLKFLTQYMISFDANGGAGGPASQVKTYGTALTLSSTVPTHTGYSFQGWSTSASATTATYPAGGSYTANAAVTLYAVWRPNTYTVSLDANGGTIGQTSISVIYGNAYGNLPVPTREGYQFDGWYTASAGGVSVVNTTTVTTANKHTLYARWREITELQLPTSLNRIEDEAFMGCALTSVVIPEQCEYIGNKAFANSDKLLYVYFPQTNMQIASDAFWHSPNVSIICHKDSSAHDFAKANGIPYVLYKSDWVLESEVPQGVRITAEKWTYKRATTETTTSTAESMNGWTQTGFTWQRTGGGTHTYAYYPAGFDTGHTLYSYAKGPLSSSTSGNTKREAYAASHKSYIYWHWTFTDVVNDTNRNVVIDDKRGYGVDVYGNGKLFRDFIYFDAFETTLSLSPEGMASGGLTTIDGVFSTYHHPEYNLPEYASWWWFRFDVYQQSYTDYQKLFSYQKTTYTEEESTSPVSEGGNISNVRHLVKYEF